LLPNGTRRKISRWIQAWCFREALSGSGGGVPTVMNGMRWFIPGQEHENAAVRFARAEHRVFTESKREKRKFLYCQGMLIYG
jgi:hypothetical protein